MSRVDGRAEAADYGAKLACPSRDATRHAEVGRGQLPEKSMRVKRAPKQRARSRALKTARTAGCNGVRANEVDAHVF